MRGGLHGQIDYSSFHCVPLAAEVTMRLTADVVGEPKHFLHHFRASVMLCITTIS